MPNTLQKIVKMSGPAVCDGRRSDCIFQDQIPPDDPREQALRASHTHRCMRNPLPEPWMQIRHSTARQKCRRLRRAQTRVSTPARPCRALPRPVRTKMPVPIIAPTPRLVSVTGPRTRRSRFSPFISSSSRASGFLSKSGFAIGLPLSDAQYTRYLENLSLRVFESLS